MNAPKRPDAATARAAVEDALAGVFAPSVRALDLRLVELTDDGVVLSLPVTPAHVHGGGVLCGQTMMAAADTAMVLAIVAQLGAFRPMTTVQLQTSFLRPVAGDAGHATVQARVLRSGRNLVFGEIDVLDAGGRLAARSTTTYALL